MDGTETVGYKTDMPDFPLLCLPCAEKAPRESDPTFTPMTLEEAYRLCEDGADQCSACNNCLIEQALVEGHITSA